MPSADFRYAMGLPYGLLTRLYACCCMPIFVFPPPCGVRLAGGQDAMTHRRRGFGLPVLPSNPVIFQRQLPRRSGSPGVSTGYFQRTIVRYTRLNHLTDRGLYPVLRTRPGLAPPQICLPSTFRYGAYLYVDPRFCLRLPSADALLQRPCLQLSFPSVRVDLDFVRYLCQNTGHHHLAAGPSPAHNKSFHRKSFPLRSKVSGELQRYLPLHHHTLSWCK